MSTGSKITNVLKRLSNRFRVGADYGGYLPPQEVVPANLLAEVQNAPLEKSPFFLGKTSTHEETKKMSRFESADHLPTMARWMRDEAKVDKWYEKLTTVGLHASGVGYRDYEDVPAGEYMSTEELYGEEVVGWDSYDYYDITKYTIDARRRQSDYDPENA